MHPQLCHAVLRPYRAGIQSQMLTPGGMLTAHTLVHSTEALCQLISYSPILSENNSRSTFAHPANAPSNESQILIVLALLQTANIT